MVILVRDENQGVSWAKFLEIFYEKYFPRCIRDRKVSEFKGLKQGNQKVVEYKARFIELAWFALYMVDTNYIKARKFEGGLQNAIQEKVNALKLPMSRPQTAPSSLVP